MACVWRHGISGLDLADQHRLCICVVDLGSDVFAVRMARTAIGTIRVTSVGLGMLSVRVFFLAKGTVELAVSAVVIVFLRSAAVSGNVS